MSQLSSSLLVRLVDNVTAPARRVAQSIKGIGDSVRQINNRISSDLTGGVTKAIKANERAVSRMRGKLLDGLALGSSLWAGLSAPTSLARDFESVLLDIGQKADLSKEQISGLGAAIRKLAPEINQTSIDTAKGVDFLAGMGLSPDKALTFMKPIGRVATAYKAEVEDVAKAVYSVFDNLDVDPSEIERALDVMAQAGKEGAFELKDMAGEFPALTAQAKALGMEGVKGVAQLAAMLQVARKGAGTSAEAATNTANLMQKVLSPETTKKFKAAGIDIRAEIKKTIADGGDVFETVARLTKKATKGDMSLLGDLFQDMQVQQALRPLIENLDEYIRIRDKATTAKDVVGPDFNQRMETAAARQKKFIIGLQELGITIGNIVLPPLNELFDLLNGWASRLREVAEAHPKLIRAAIMATAALIGLRVASIGLQYGLLNIKGAVLNAISALSWLGRAAAMVTLAPLRSGLVGLAGLAMGAAASIRRMTLALLVVGRIGGLRAVLSTVVTAIGGLGRGVLLFPITALRAISLAMWSLVANPVGAIIAAIVAALTALGVWIYNNWAGITQFFSSFAEAFTKALGPSVGEAIGTVTSGLKSVFDWLGNILGPIDETGVKWKGWGEAAGKAVADVVNWLIGLPEKIATGAGDLYQAGANMIQRLWDGMVAKFDALVEWIKGIPKRIVDSVGNIDLSSMIKWPSFPSWGGGGGSEPGPQPAPEPAPAEQEGQAWLDGFRAKGGPVSPGGVYLVGEKGPEIFSPASSGQIIPNHRAGAALASGANSRPISVSLSMGNIVVQHAANADDLAENIGSKLEAKLRALVRGLQADLGYTS